jgi:beta-phosphoglucomutase-like phosphatase (HAD superfamily)
MLFDLDGTLVDTVDTRIEAWMKTFDEIGIRADHNHVARLIGADGKRLAREVAGVAGREITDDRAEAIDRRAGELFSTLNTDPQPLPGAGPLLHALERSRLPWAIATSSRPEQVLPSIESLGLAIRPKIVDGSHVEHAKPAPDLLLEGAELIGVPSHLCWCIGDSTWDMRAAKAAPMIAVGVPTGAVSADDLIAAGANAVASLSEIESDFRRRGLLD